MKMNTTGFNLFIHLHLHLYFFTLLVFFLLTSCQCSNKEQILNKEQFVERFLVWYKKEMKNEGRSQLEIDDYGPLSLVKDDVIKIDPCTRYSNPPEGLLGCYTIKVKLVEFIAVELASMREARQMAMQFNGVYLNNWFFDDVYGEPILEKILFEEFGAKKYIEL